MPGQHMAAEPDFKVDFTANGIPARKVGAWSPHQPAVLMLPCAIWQSPSLASQAPVSMSGAYT